jgi:ribonuclease R
VKERILQLLTSKDYVPMSRNAVAGALSLQKRERVELRRALRELQAEGKVVRIDRRRYAPAAPVSLVVGVLKGHPRGFGFVIPEEKSIEDLYVHRENMGTALDGDRVLVRPFSTGRRYRGGKTGLEGEIVRVIERARREIVGELRRSGHFYYVMPENRGIFQDIYVSEENLKGAKVGDRVVSRIVQWESKHLNPEGKIVKVLGGSDDWRTDLASVMVRFGYRRGFPRRAGEEASAVPDGISPGELKKRKDLRDEVTITIDPEDAKDFDDAISLKRDEEGGWVLGVHIADVAHYVKEGSQLEVEACRRGNSVYLLNDVVPMLPRRLSSDLCSLKEGCDRLTKTVLMNFSRTGALKGYEILDSLIQCKRRFSFKQVNEILAGERESSFKERLEEMAELSRRLLRKRIQRGALVFDMVEAKVVFDGDGNISGIEKRRQEASESLVEEFMLAANETVAKHLRKHKVPTIYRVHDEPDSEKMEEFSRTAGAFGYAVTDSPSRAEVNEVLSEARGKPESYLMNLAFLRSLKMAEYSVRNKGHYGLASKNYLHFTSPIRRYPDLVVHRCLDRLRERGPKESFPERKDLAKVAAQCSETERQADAAEKEVVQAGTLRYLKRLFLRNPGRVFSGLITNISRYEIMVYLSDFVTEGSVRLRSLVGDFYRFDRKERKLIGVRTRRTFREGQVVKVKIKAIDVIRRDLELDLVW